jgi:DNA-directed RNA polymerase specialized sigma subunit
MHGTTRRRSSPSHIESQTARTLRPACRDWLSRTVKEEKDRRDAKIFEMWLACHTQEEIAEALGCSVQPVKEVVSDFQCRETENPKPQPIT